MKKAAFATLLEHYRSIISESLSQKYGCGSDIIEDAIQDVALKFLEHKTYMRRNEEHMIRLLWYGVEMRVRDNYKGETKRRHWEREACYQSQCW